MEHLDARDNSLESLGIQPRLEWCNVEHNQLTIVETQPSLKRLYAKGNPPMHLHAQPNLVYLDVDDTVTIDHQPQLSLDNARI